MSSSTSHKFLDNDSVCKSLTSKWRRLFHPGPLFGLGLVICFTICGTSICVSTIFRLSVSLGIANLLIFCGLSFCTLRSYVLSAWYGPGFVKLGWSPRNPEDKSKLQFCSACEGYKPPRAHHCKTCGRCVMKMDHHCPWINCCVGHLNHGFFLHFIVFAPLGCLHCCGLCGYRLYYILTRSYLLFRHGFDYKLAFSFYDFIWVLICLGLACGVTISVGILAYFQLRGISRNKTVIENWIVAKAIDRRCDEENEPPMVFPYDLGWKQNIRQVLSLSGNPVGDGFTWPLKAGCKEYDLTIEQLRQKEVKNRTACVFNIVRAYNGKLLPVSFGCYVCCCQPCSGEKRIAVAVDDKVLVTRGHKWWYYGQLMNSACVSNGLSTKDAIRGWFPKSCAVIATASKVKTG